MRAYGKAFAQDAAPRPEQYVSLLEAHLGKSGFWDIYKQLEQDLAMNAKAKQTIARGFTDNAGTSAKKAMRRIAARQEALETAKAKSESRMGRSAA